MTDAEIKNKIRLITSAIKYYRIHQGETVDSMAYKLGYKDSSTYRKIERGDFATVDLFKLIEICNLIKVSPFILCLQAEINLLTHKHSLLSWDEFYESLQEHRSDIVDSMDAGKGD